LIHAATEKAFNTVDVDQSGSVDSKELELAVTTLYAEINKYVRVKRPRRQQIQSYVDKIDVDRDGTLDRAEFNVVMKLMCENVEACGLHGETIITIYCGENCERPRKGGS